MRKNTDYTNCKFCYNSYSIFSLLAFEKFIVSQYEASYMILRKYSVFRNLENYMSVVIIQNDRLYGLAVRVLATDLEVPGSVPGANRFSEKWMWNGSHSAS
jgi:hypothetical protein